MYTSLRRSNQRSDNTTKKPWITKTILKSIRMQNKLFEEYLRSERDIDYLEYKSYRNKLTHIKEIAKATYNYEQFKNWFIFGTSLTKFKEMCPNIMPCRQALVSERNYSMILKLSSTRLTITFFPLAKTRLKNLAALNQ